MSEETIDHPETESSGHPTTLDEIKGLGQYLAVFGSTLGRKANASLSPLHVPDRDALPSFSAYGREPYPAQAHIATANSRLLTQSNSGIISGECGTGKTIVSILSIDQAARRGRRKGGKNGNYIVAVVCPDHLIKKWCREISDTIPGVTVRRFGRDDENGDENTSKKAWIDFMSLLDEYNPVRRMSGGMQYEIANGKRWAKPKGPNWFVFGRNQIKWYPDRRSMGEEYRGIDGKLRKNRPYRHFLENHVDVKDEAGNQVYRPGSSWEKVRKAVYGIAPVCPKCGERCFDDRGPLSWSGMHKRKARLYTCPALYLEEIVDPGRCRESGRDRLPISGDKYSFRDKGPGREVKIGGKTYVVRQCGERWWQYTRKPYRWSIAQLVQKKMRGFFDYMIVDECHEHKDPRSIQSVAFGKFLSACPKSMALTGTLINGYADSLFYLLMRMSGRNLVQRGFEWGDGREAGPFTEEYGRIDRVESSTAPLEAITRKGSGKKFTMSKPNIRCKRAPGVMPTLFGHILAPVTTFITLEEMADELPDLTEILDEGCVVLPSDIKAEYERLESTLVREARRLMAKGNMKLLGTMLQTLLAYPDHPYDWFPMFEGEETIGHWINTVADHPELMKRENWQGIISPWNFNVENRILPKEQKLIDIVKRGLARGEQTWAYIQMTKKHNVMPRLQQLLGAAGIRAGVLNDYDADPTEREDWIRDHGDQYDIIMSYPKLVSTGLDLFWKEDQEYKYNFNNLVFYQTGYNLFDLRQASRRSWRLGQDRDCTVYYMYYRDTMQHRAMELMSRKLEAALQIEGEFSEDGLAALSSDSSIQMELCKKLSAAVDADNLGRSWVKVKAGGRKKYKSWEERSAEEAERKKGEPRQQGWGESYRFLMRHPKSGDWACDLVHALPEAYIRASDPTPGKARPDQMLTRFDVTRERWEIVTQGMSVEALGEVMSDLWAAGFTFDHRDVGAKRHEAGAVPFETGVPEPGEHSEFDSDPLGVQMIKETIVAHPGSASDWDWDDDPVEAGCDFGKPEPASAAAGDEDDGWDWGEVEDCKPAEEPQAGTETLQVVELGNGQKVGFVATPGRAEEIAGQFNGKVEHAPSRPSRSEMAERLARAMAKAEASSQDEDDGWDW